MIRWKQHGCTDPVYASECGLFVIYRNPRGDVVVKRFDSPDETKPAETSGPLPSVEAAKQWCEARSEIITAKKPEVLA